MEKANLSSLALQDLHNTILQQLASISGKFGMISILNNYNDELVARNNRSLSQHVSRLISDIRSSKVDNQWVIDKIKGYLNQEYSRTMFQKQQYNERIDSSLSPRGVSNSKYQSILKSKSDIIDTKIWSKQSNWLIIENLINQFKTNNEFKMVLSALNELRNHLSSSLTSKKIRELGKFISNMKLTNRFDTVELITLLRSIQVEYR